MKIIIEHILLPAVICIYFEILKVLPIVIQELLGFDKFRFLTFDLHLLDHHPPKAVTNKFTLRSTIPENFKSLASAVQKL